MKNDVNSEVFNFHHAKEEPDSRHPGFAFSLFAKPIAANGWYGTRDASVEGNMCLQPSDNGVLGKTVSTTSWIGDEDCLYLNVYTPKVPRSLHSSLLPVMVFIHGGAYVSWSSAVAKFGPKYILDENVILVTLNYRLGAFGFLSTGDEVASGNWALKDQILALEWVQDNIKFFGGNPDQVTLFGQSAGAASIHLLSLSDATIGLFHKYIIQSGSALTPWAFQPRVTYGSQAFELGKSVGCFNDTTDSLISCLRTVNGSDIINKNLHPLSLETFSSSSWSPTDEPDIEGAVLKDSPANLLAAGQGRDLPRICGVTRDEGLVLTAELYEDEKRFDHFLKNFDALFPALVGYKSDEGAAQLKAIQSYYFNNDLTANKNLLLANLTKAIGDSQLIYPTYDALRQQLAFAVEPRYFYEFSYTGSFSFTYVSTNSTEVYGASHCDDLIYLFSSPDFYSGLLKTMSRIDHNMIRIMVKLWTSFAINGTPSIACLNNTTTWNPYSMADNYFQIGSGSDSIVSEQFLFLKERMQFWTSLQNITET